MKRNEILTKQNMIMKWCLIIKTSDRRNEDPWRDNFPLYPHFNFRVLHVTFYMILAALVFFRGEVQIFLCQIVKNFVILSQKILLGINFCYYILSWQQICIMNFIWTIYKCPIPRNYSVNVTKVIKILGILPRKVGEFRPRNPENNEDRIYMILRVFLILIYKEQFVS